MGLFKGIKAKVGQYALKKAAAVNSQRLFINWNDVSKVQILFHRSNQAEADTMAKFARFLLDEGKKVDVLIFVDSKKIDETLQNRTGLTYYCRKNLNWFGKPKDEFFNEFIKQPSDLLIVADFYKHFHFKWIATLSKSKSVVAPFNEDNNWATLLIKIDNNNLDNFLKQSIHYLGFINKK